MRPGNSSNSWLRRSPPGRPAGTFIMYGVGGEHDLSELELTHLPGWRSSSRSASATAPGTSASCMSTAKCLTPRPHCWTSSPPWTPTRIAFSPTRPPHVGRTQTRASERSAGAPPLPAFKAHVLGGRRAGSSPSPTSLGLGADPSQGGNTRSDRRDNSCQWLKRCHERLYPGIRLR